MEYIAHTDPESGREQSLLAHLTGTAQLAAGFAASFGAQDAAYRCGLLHDIGKYSAAFQKRIRGANLRVDHSSAGAVEAFQRKDLASAFAIAGHHGGMPDHGSRFDLDGKLLGRVQRKPGQELEDYAAYVQELSVPPAQTPERLTADSWSGFFYIRMLYSCLVDADWLDTERFMQGTAPQRGGGESLTVLSEKLDKRVSEWANPTRELDVRRTRILHSLMEAGSAQRGIYTLTVPTGGGKTVSSMAFALRHALAQGQRRILYVIPYTSIIEQTQAVFEEIFGAENVVAHYANVSYQNDENGQRTPADQRRYLATENWDAPIVLTTAVQFFESLFANRPSKCRKLHNIANSVLIFDEAQMLPVNYLSPCVSAITELVRNYGCTAVLCTATQPALGPLIEKRLHRAPVELCPGTQEAHEFFRRVRYQHEGLLSDEALAERLAQEEQALCVVNSRAQAQRLYALLPREGSFHLSTAMTAQHRRAVLQEIRRRLFDGEPCRVVSTSLIEAGVDVDFPTVWRAMAGLDSIIQAGGRCNREGKRAAQQSVVHIFDSETKPPRGLAQNIAAAQQVIGQYEDIASPAAVTAYFRFLLYHLKDEATLDEKDILRLAQRELAFETIAERFHIIAEVGRTVYIPRGEGAALTRRLRQEGPSRELLRQLGAYAVTVYERDYEKLPIEFVSEDSGILADMREYSEETGLNLSPQGGGAIVC